ncbi:MAG: hypothetical protein AVDCRST_MAG41-3359 [uncultured Corynebacteriales bacterium]|uniref:Protein arginine N-methyltransferase domain-containing protein n=1 Tax=uncultured Mycobacteriales bacterium TaxID=581187 RepID=A0A6J4JDR3_9ACTN|nr:MAG: hypothetical protein AVDCRST_MAG41-3359 [uncultured Corynebacteriales bacterium]
MTSVVTRPLGPFAAFDGREALLRRGEEALARRDYASAVHLLGLAGGHLAAPHDRTARLMNRAVRELVPRWHFSMLNDDARNTAYRRAIEAVVRPGDLVLDIGTGAGLLSLFAARAGARVVTCEVEPLVAAVAEQVVADNGLSDRISVVNARSTDLRVGVELPDRADVLVTEIFDCGLLGEHVLPVLAHARRELLRPDSRLVPGSARLWAQLVDSEQIWARNSVTEVAGFDLSAFAQLRSLEYFSTYVHQYEHTPLTDPFPVLDVDFSTRPGPAEVHLEVPVTAGGRAHAVVMWFELALSPGVTLCNDVAENPQSHWRQAVQTFDRPLECAAGGTVPLLAVHDGERVLVRPQQPAGGPATR